MSGGSDGPTWSVRLDSASATAGRLRISPDSGGGGGSVNRLGQMAAAGSSQTVVTIRLEGGGQKTERSDDKTRRSMKTSRLRLRQVSSPSLFVPSDVSQRHPCVTIVVCASLIVVARRGHSPSLR